MYIENRTSKELRIVMCSIKNNQVIKQFTLKPLSSKKIEDNQDTELVIG